MKDYSVKMINDGKVIVDSVVNKFHLKSICNLMSMLKSTKNLEKIEIEIKK